MSDFLIGSFLEWFPRVISGAAVLAALFFYFRYPREQEGKRKHLFIGLVFLLLALWVLNAGLLTWGQSYVWSQDALSRSLLTTSLPKNIPVPLIEALPGVFQVPSGYFVFYSLQHFWFPLLLSAFLAFLFFLFLKMLQRYNERFFEAGETELGFLLALAVGWPKFVVFLPLALLFVVLVSVIRGIVTKERYTTLGIPLLIAAIVTLAAQGLLHSLLLPLVP